MWRPELSGSGDELGDRGRAARVIDEADLSRRGHLLKKPRRSRAGRRPTGGIAEDSPTETRWPAACARPASSPFSATWLRSRQSVRPRRPGLRIGPGAHDSTVTTARVRRQLLPRVRRRPAWGAGTLSDRHRAGDISQLSRSLKILIPSLYGRLLGFNRAKLNGSG